MHQHNNHTQSTLLRPVPTSGELMPLTLISGNFGYMGRSNPWGDLDRMWHVGRYGGRNHVCNIWCLSIKGCGCGKKGKFAFSH